MARTHFQKLGVWFPRAGKTALISAACTEFTMQPAGADARKLYLYASAYYDEGENSISYFNEENVWPDDGNYSLVAELEATAAYNPISDIPEGVLFYLTDSAEASEPSEDAKEAGLGVYITWSE